MIFTITYFTELCDHRGQQSLCSQINEIPLVSLLRLLLTWWKDSKTHWHHTKPSNLEVHASSSHLYDIKFPHMIFSSSGIKSCIPFFKQKTTLISTNYLVDDKEKYNINIVLLLIPVTIVILNHDHPLSQPPHLTNKVCMCATKTKICVSVMKDFSLAIISLRCNTVTMAGLQNCLWLYRRVVLPNILQANLSFWQKPGSCTYYVYKAWRITFCVLSRSPANRIPLSKLQLWSQTLKCLVSWLYKVSE
mgnify:CR=1 FL=1